MKKPMVSIAIAAVVLAVVSIVALGGNSSPRDPMTGQNEFDIPVQDPVLVAEGGDLYRANCAACHGSNLTGTAVGPSQLSVVYQPGHHPNEAYISAIRNGVPAHHWDFGDMAPVVGLSQGDMDRIVTFVRETQRIEGFEAYPPR
ncbi:MAG: c-type cytochrome [Actinomycetia bacterium]|nr:c-type cytochrome [Actinomycetes bacterium]